MSFHLKRLPFRGFSTKPPIFRSEVIYPDSKPEPPSDAHFLSQIEKLSKRRLWLKFQKEKKANQMFNFKTTELSEHENPEVKGEIGKLGDPYELDRETGLPLDMGFDRFIEDLKQSRETESKQDKFRDLYRKLGFHSARDVLSAVRDIDISGELESIKAEVYSRSHKVAETPYRKIQNEKFPESRQKKGPIEYFSEDFSEKEPEEIGPDVKELMDKMTIRGFIEPEDYPPADFNDYFGFYADRIEYRKHSTYIPSWVNKEIENMNRRMQQGGIQEVQKKAEKIYKEKIRGPFKFFESEGKMNTRDFFKQKRKFQPRVPSFKEIMHVVEDFLVTSTKEVYHNHKRDLYEKNYHFEPQYLNKDFTQEDFDWSIFPKKEESIIPEALKGKLRMDYNPEELVYLEDTLNQWKSQGYQPSQETSLVAKVYSLMRNDSYHQHYLGNQIKYWSEFVRTRAGFRNNVFNPSKAAPLIPWEHITIPKQQLATEPLKIKPVLDELGRAQGSGFRKSASAMAWVYPGTGKITVNGKNLVEYFPEVVPRDRVVLPFKFTGSLCEFDVKVNVKGGGFLGQSEACKLAISRALLRYEPSTKKILKEGGLLKRDPRVKERKKTSKLKARKSYTYVKR